MSQVRCQGQKVLLPPAMMYGPLRCFATLARLGHHNNGVIHEKKEKEELGK